MDATADAVPPIMDIARITLQCSVCGRSESFASNQHVLQRAWAAGWRVKQVSRDQSERLQCAVSTLHWVCPDEAKSVDWHSDLYPSGLPPEFYKGTMTLEEALIAKEEDDD